MANLLVPLSAPTWHPLGVPISHPYVLAVSATWNSSSSTGGPTPLLAYGAADEQGDTTSRILAWHPSNSSWVQVASHTPQFAQPYEHFDARERGGRLYLGLEINPSDVSLSSILRGGESPSGGDDGWVGAYAFGAGAWDFAVTPDGDAVVAFTPDNATLALSTYSASGWDSYPAGDAWSPQANVSTPNGGVAAVVVAAGGAADGSPLYVASTSAGGGSAGNPSVQVGATALTANTTDWTAMGAPFAAATLDASASAALAWGASNATSGAGTLCTAAVDSTGSLRVACCSAGGGGGAGQCVWGTPDAAVKAVSSRLPPGIAVLPIPGGAQGGNLVVVVGASASSDTTLVGAACTIPAASGKPPACANWAGAALAPLDLGASINNFVLRAPSEAVGSSGGESAPSSSVPVLLAVSVGPADGTGDAVQALTLTGSGL
jgi:hypothetical protein